MDKNERLRFELKNDPAKRLVSESMVPLRRPGVEKATAEEERRDYLNARVRVSIHQRVKIAAIQDNRRLQDWVEEALLEKLQREGK